MDGESHQGADTIRPLIVWKMCTRIILLCDLCFITCLISAPY